MRNRIDIDHAHSRAIVRELGERLRGFVRGRRVTDQHRKADSAASRVGRRVAPDPDYRRELRKRS